jgi:hypothetical protein
LEFEVHHEVKKRQRKRSEWTNKEGERAEEMKKTRGRDEKRKEENRSQKRERSKKSDKTTTSSNCSKCV